VDTLLARAQQANLTVLVDYTAWRDERGLPKGVGANLGWGTSVRLLNENPDTVRAFLRGLARATDRLRRDRDFGISVLSDKPFEIEQSVVGEVYDRHKDHWMVRMDLEKGDSAFDAEMVEVVMELKKGSITPRKYADEGPATAVLKELNLRF
jgi:hypothetical protein